MKQKKEQEDHVVLWSYREIKTQRSRESFREEVVKELNPNDYFDGVNGYFYRIDLEKIIDKKYYAYVGKFINEYRDEELKHHGYTLKDGVLDQQTLMFMCNDGHRIMFEH